MKFVKILNNYPIYQNNIIKINNALHSNKITQIQSKLLLSNNSKWYNTCEHKGLLGFKDGKIIFIPRTSYDYILSKPRTLEQIKANTEVFNEKKIEFYRFNELCNIGSLKWVLGNEDDNINIQNLEDRTDILARLVGSLDDLNDLKEWVANTDLEYFDISPYFNLDDTIDELTSSNLIKDE